VGRRPILLLGGKLEMTLQEIYNYLNTISPFNLQEKWDNSGLIVGNMNKEVSKVVLSIDIDKELIDNSDENILFIVHHPLIFGGIDSLDFSKYPSNLLEMMLNKNQSCIAMHTNFDKTHLNKYVFENILGFKDRDEKDFLCSDNIKIESKKLLSHIKDKLNLDILKVVSEKDEINSISLCTGAGASLIDEVDADCFLTGDIKYHDAMKAKSQNLMMVDIGHYESEKFFSEILAKELEKLPLIAIVSYSKNPFIIK